MAKRSREDFEPSSPESEATRESTPSAGLVVPSPNPATSNTPKIVHLDRGSGEPPAVTEMRCSLPGHRQTLSFTSFEEYDVHYAKTHVNRCVECRKNFPTEHFLNLHIEENHDALVSVRRERGEKTYSCFVEDCDRKCSTPQKRRMHLIDKHMFPKEYDFYVVNDGVDRRTSMLRSGKHRRRSSAAQHMTEIEERRRRNSTLEASPSEKQEGSGDPDAVKEENMEETSPKGAKDVDMDLLSGALSALKFVPPSVRFGRGGRRAGFSRS
ncbi:hypothetical protein N431DRAFT_218723 [Stipitochalara longipes BDJ]|nr:hypothetical protein N431DRAFT_218723 [Stipitochalara longipes BDJ]